MKEVRSSLSAPNYKANVDGAIINQDGKSGVRVVIRDHEGKVTAVLSQKIHQLLRPLEIEAKAMGVGVLFAWDVGIRNVFDCDSKIVFDALLGLCSPCVSILNILARVSQKFHDFRLAQVSHVRQQGNRLTHLLAEHAKDIDNGDNFVT